MKRSHRILDIVTSSIQLHQLQRHHCPSKGPHTSSESENFLWCLSFVLWSFSLVTVRNEVAKVMFLQVSVCLQGGIPACLAGGIPACLAAGLQGYPSMPCSRSPGGIPACLAGGACSHREGVHALGGACSRGVLALGDACSRGGMVEIPPASRRLLLHPTGMHSCYQPQRSCGQGNVFTGVCLSTGGRVSASVPAGMPYPLGWRPPQMENPPGMENPPRWRTPPLDGEYPPQDGEPPLDGEPPQMGQNWQNWPT